MRRVFLLPTLGWALLWPAPANAATELLKTHSGSPVHWTRTQISVALDASAESRSVSREAVERAIDRAAATWNAVRAGQPRLYLAVQERADVHIGFCRGTWRGDVIDLGRTRFTADARDGKVSAATVEINECDHPFKVEDPTLPKAFELQAVLTHELGHVLGLGHSTDGTAVMHPNGRDGAHLRQPNAEDQTALALLYVGRFTADQLAAALPLPPQTSPPVVAPPPPSITEEPAADPTELVSVLSMTTVKGKQVMVYTCEPTLLPPMDSAERRPRRHAKRGSR